MDEGLSRISYLFITDALLQRDSRPKWLRTRGTVHEDKRATGEFGYNWSMYGNKVRPAVWHVFDSKGVACCWTCLVFVVLLGVGWVGIGDSIYLLRRNSTMNE